jgi:hypothetical protein
MEAEVDSLLRASQAIPSSKGTSFVVSTPAIQQSSLNFFTDFNQDGEHISPKINIEEMYSKVRMALDDGEKTESKTELSREAFWREMDQSEDSFQTIARFFAKGVIQ